MAENPWDSVPPSDPNVRIYQVADHRHTNPREVIPTPVYRGEALSTVVFCLEPGQVHEPHTHQGINHMWVVLEGTGECIMDDGRSEPVGPGSICVHERTRLHGLRNTGGVQLLYVNVSAGR